jgi:hypothetical protein
MAGAKSGPSPSTPGTVGEGGTPKGEEEREVRAAVTANEMPALSLWIMVLTSLRSTRTLRLVCIHQQTTVFASAVTDNGHNCVKESRKKDSTLGLRQCHQVAPTS